MSDTSRTVSPLRAGESGDPEIDAFLRDSERGWLQDPRLVSVFARVPEGLRGWRRLVEATVAAVGPVAWELVAHRTAAVTGSDYRTSQPDESVGERVDSLCPALAAPHIQTDGLSKREALAVSLADAVARHEVSSELFSDLKAEYQSSELVGLCMAASLSHVSHLVFDALALGSHPASSGDYVAVEKSRSR